MKRELFTCNPTDSAIEQIPVLSPARRAALPEKLKKETIDGHLLVAQSLKRLGVTHVYCVSGTPVWETFAACAKMGIRLIGVRHQQAGVMMAIAQNYVAGRLTAISLLSAGPAVTNAATGILVARDNCWPVVVLGGRRPLSMQGIGSFQDLDAVPIFQSITKWSALVESTSSIPAYLDRAFQTAVCGRPGPVYLDLPEDVLTGLGGASESGVHDAPELPTLETDAIARAADILIQAKRPAIIIGKGIRWSEPYEELKALVNGFGIPFITSPMGHGYLPDDHPLCYNATRGLLQSSADVVLLVGARLDWTFRFGTEMAPNVKLIHVDIHEQEIGLNVTPTVGIVGDAKQVLRQLLIHLELKGKGRPRERLSCWCAILDEQRRKRDRELESQMNSDAVRMSPYRMLKEVRDFLPRDAICVLDGNVFMAAAQQVLPAYLPVSRLTAGSNGCMGVGIPFGIGAKLARPDRLVMSICGDTAFAFNAMDMETAVRHGVALMVVVVNNEGISGATVQKALFPWSHERVAMFQPGIHYEHIMGAFGGHCEFVERPEQLKPALERALASGAPACINVQVDPDAPYPRD